MTKDKTKPKEKPEDSLVEQGQRLQYFRENIIKKNRKEVSTELGIGENQYAKYELAYSATSQAVMIHFHNKYGMSYDWFFEGILPMVFTPDKPKTGIIDITAMQLRQDAADKKIKALQSQILKQDTVVKALNDKLNAFIIETRKR